MEFVMKKHELFLQGCRAERWKWRSWRISLFSVSRRNVDIDPVEYDFDYKNDCTYVYINNSWEVIEDAIPLEPLFNNRGLAAFPANFFANHPEEIETTYGRALFNLMVMCYAFGDKMPFVHKQSSSQIAEAFIPQVVREGDLPANGKPPIYPKEIAKFVQAILETTSLCPYITPTGTEKSLTTDPRVYKRRKELFKEYEGRMTPEIMSRIEAELTAMDREWLNDDSKDFYIKKKAFDVTRKKMFVVHGIEQAFKDDGTFDVIEKSLVEGSDLNHITAKNNSTREGSFDRGNNTAFGGAKASKIQRIGQDVSIDIEHDCGAPYDPILINEYSKKHFLNMNYVDKDGNVSLITDEVIKANMGKTLNVRRPMLCRAGTSDIKRYCAHCTSLLLINNPTGIRSMLYGVGSEIMYVFMSAMHGTALETSKFNYKFHIK